MVRRPGPRWARAVALATRWRLATLMALGMTMLPESGHTNPTANPTTAAATATTTTAATVNLDALWDFRQPALSEQRLRQAWAAAPADSDEAWVLQTQVARALGLQQRFDEARALLDRMADRADTAGAEVRVRWRLERGRSWASATHPPATQTDEARARARAWFVDAAELARQSALDGLAIDAIHMLAFVDTAPAQQLHWAQQALAVVQQSSQPAARRWEASVRHNLGHALLQLGRHEEALGEFRAARALRERSGDAQAIHVARWMEARALRALGRHHEALAIQRQLAEVMAAEGRQDPHVDEEISLLLRALR